MSGPREEVPSLVRAATPGDGDAVRRVVGDAFGDEGALVVRLCAVLDEGRHTRAALVAEVGSDVVGHVQLSRCWVDAREALVEVVVLSPLSVLTTHQRLGIGSQLIEAALGVASAGPWPAVFLEGSPTYYGSRGFTAAGPLGFEKPSARIPDAAFQVALNPTYEPWMTGRLVYCDPFWSLDCVGLRDPLLAEMEKRYRG